ncbi:hypothetical protein SDC9_91437 [bioreactor metagenome]|uniref:Uncharacterized protein n=1 Tax=bioreactor metagenome TaxID=1076179 RepID=A0A644ZVM4_9ZZZZ
MAQSDRAAVDVKLLLGQVQRLDAGHRLGGKGLVKLDEVNVLQGHTGLLKRLWNGPNRTDAHHGGVNAHGRIG